MYTQYENKLIMQTAFIGRIKTNHSLRKIELTAEMDLLLKSQL